MLVIAATWGVAPNATARAVEPDQREKEQTLAYPDTTRGDQVDDYHGTTIADPYRWLEDLDSDETKAWVEAENQVTRGYLDVLPQRDRIRERLEKLWDYERFGLPHERGDRYFFTHNDGLQNQSVLYAADALDAEPRVLLDPNTLSADGTVDLSGWTPSKDGHLLAFGLSSAGSDWKELHVLDTATGQRLDDHVRWVKFSGMSWTPDGKGFYYSRYDEPKEGAEFTGTNYYQKLYFHRLGEPQQEDILVYERPDEKEWGFDGDVTEDGRYLIISVWRGTERKNQVFYQDLQKPDAPVVELITGFDAEYHFLDNDGPVFWFLTDSDATNRRVIAVDTSRADRENWRELIAERPEALRGVSVVGDVFIASYLKDACSEVRIHDFRGRYLRDLELPGRGSAGGFTGRRGDRESFYSYTDFVTPTTIFRYDLATGESTVYRKPNVDFASDDYETKQVFFESRDGTRIPMFITHKKGLVPNGECPTLLYGYGGFNAAITPGYSVFNAVWLEMGGVYAVPNLRGGGEYGRHWHEAGMVHNKQNVFDDYLGAAEWLIASGYTSPSKLAIRGGSNGGLLVGAAMTQRPDLFALALPAVGVMDMLRYHKFTIGWAWVSEYGSSDDPEHFKTLLAYSPLHNLKPGTRYPATLVTTGDHDDRVVPSHSFKYAATLQRAQATDGPPVLIRIETSAGHGAGKPTSKLIDEAADELSFTAAQLGMKPR
jgi:prolyl oligopeptidase